MIVWFRLLLFRFPTLRYFGLPKTPVFCASSVALAMCWASFRVQEDANRTRSGCEYCFWMFCLMRLSGCNALLQICDFSWRWWIDMNVLYMPTEWLSYFQAFILAPLKYYRVLTIVISSVCSGGNAGWLASADVPQHITLPSIIIIILLLLHFAWGVAQAKCILVTVICVSVCVSELSVPRRIPTLLHGSGCNLGGW